MKKSEDLSLHHLAQSSVEDLIKKLCDQNELTLLKMSSLSADETIAQRDKRTVAEIHGNILSGHQYSQIKEACALLQVYTAMWCVLHLPPPEYKFVYDVNMEYRGDHAYTCARTDLIYLQKLRLEICGEADRGENQTASLPKSVGADKYPRSDERIMNYMSVSGRALFDLVKDIEKMRYSGGSLMFPTFLKNLKAAVFPTCNFDKTKCFDISILARPKADINAVEAAVIAEMREALAVKRVSIPVTARQTFGPKRSTPSRSAQHSHLCA